MSKVVLVEYLCPTTGNRVFWNHPINAEDAMELCRSLKEAQIYVLAVSCPLVVSLASSIEIL